MSGIPEFVEMESIIYDRHYINIMFLIFRRRVRVFLHQPIYYLTAHQSEHAPSPLPHPNTGHKEPASNQLFPEDYVTHTAAHVPEMQQLLHAFPPHDKPQIATNGNLEVQDLPANCEGNSVQPAQHVPAREDSSLYPREDDKENLSLSNAGNQRGRSNLPTPHHKHQINYYKKRI